MAPMTIFEKTAADAPWQKGRLIPSDASGSKP
jgi:hypothetical protein